MGTYIVHAKTPTGWVTLAGEGESFSEAAIAAVVQHEKDRGLDLDAIPHTVEFDDSDDYPRVQFFEASERVITTFGFCPAITKPGDWWFSVRVREGKPGDCGACGGTGLDYLGLMKCGKCQGSRKDPDLPAGEEAGDG